VAIALGKPDFGRICGPYVPDLIVRNETSCWRVYESDQVDFDATSWNTGRREIDDPGAGRFDPLPSEDTDFIYGAVSAELAIVEKCEPLAMWSPDLGGPVVRVSSLSGLSLARFSLSATVAVAQIYTSEGLAPFGVSESVCTESDHMRTREFGPFFREKAPSASGLSYKTGITQADLGGFSFLLWRDRCNGLRLLPVGGEIRLDSEAGVVLVGAILRKRRITLLP